MTTSTDDALLKLAERTGAMGPHDAGEPLCQRLAKALGWELGSARIQTLEAQTSAGKLNLSRGFLGPQPATVFAVDGTGATQHMLREAARFAYHSSVHWGIIADEAGVVVFNSHWIRDEEWFRLPEITWAEFHKNFELLTAMTPEGMADGRLDRLAASISEPDRLLMPVDDALVARLDRWRLEALRYGHDADGLDEDLHTLFAQLFVLRAVEDRGLRPDIPPLESVVVSSERVDPVLLEQLFERARETIQNQLFADDRLTHFPEFVLAGIIRDLYVPQQLPRGSQRYNFAWIDADVLGRAYEKYLANVYMAAPLAPQLRLFDQPVREVEPVSVKKSGGIFYTPNYLVGTLTDQAIEKALAEHEDVEFLPRIADFACGSGSFLVEGVSALVRRLRQRDPERNWARVLIEGKHVIGVDIDPRAVTLTRMNLWLRLTEEPNALPLPSIDEVVVLGDSLSDEIWANLPQTYDVVLGNPPFIATGSIQSREELARRFHTAQGRFDYAHLFVELAVRRLAPGGVLGMVVPNRLFRNRDAGIVREILTSQTDLLGVIDFGSSEVFKGTSGYIGAVIARKRVTVDSVQPATVRAVIVSDTSDTRYLGGLLVDALNGNGEFQHGSLKAFDIARPVGQAAWMLLSGETRRARLRLEQNAVLLGDFTGIYQGIRTGANDIFIMRVESDDGTFARVVNGLEDVAILEMSLLRRVVFGSDIQRYDLLRSDQRLLYPYINERVITEADLKERFPKVYGYLLAYQSLLTNRSSIAAGGLRWYELVRRRDETWLSRPKLVTRDLATQTSFALDDTGEVFLVGGTAVVPSDPEFALPLLAYLNSMIASEYLTHLTPAFRGAFVKFEPQHLSRLPVPRFLVDLDATAVRLGELAQQMIEARLARQDARSIESEIEDLIAASMEPDGAS